ncbi:hypothetical protein B0H11DRAFT_1924515 [Mycena galericulata]|nr:hypothetical protein B0H11DRAFT_1924515 [Mycena galericulata]
MEETSVFCAGTGPDGKCCICRQCVLKATKEPDDTDICKNCLHMESAHPSAAAPRMNMTTFVNDLHTAGKVQAGPSSTLQLKSTLSEAEAETAGGLHPKPKRKFNQIGSRTDSEPESSRKKSRTEVEKAEPKPVPVPVQKIAFLPDGTTGSGNLNHHKLTATYFDLLLSCGLAKLSTPEDPLIFCKDWTNAELRTWIKGHFSEAIRFLETHPYAADADKSDAVRRQLWHLCIKSGHKLSVSYEPLPTGANMMNICAPPGRTITQRILIISSQHRIPATRYMDWEGESETNGISDYVFSEEEEDELEMPQGKAKAKVLAESRRPKAAGSRTPAARATRLATGAIIWNKDMLVHNVDSDEDQDFPESLASLANNSANSTPTSCSLDITASTSSSAAASGSSNTHSSSGSSSIALIPQWPPLFGSFATPSPPAEDNNSAPTFFTHWPPPDTTSPNNNRWAAAVAAAADHGTAAEGSSSSAASTSRGSFLGSMRNTRPSLW